eukprot:7389926-Prymnesium_polylepis.1
MAAGVLTTRAGVGTVDAPVVADIEVPAPVRTAPRAAFAVRSHRMSDDPPPSTLSLLAGDDAPGPRARATHHQDVRRAEDPLPGEGGLDKDARARRPDQARFPRPAPQPGVQRARHRQPLHRVQPPGDERRRGLLWVRHAAPLQRPHGDLRGAVRDARGRRVLRCAAEHLGDALARRARGAGVWPRHAAVQDRHEGQVGRGARRGLLHGDELQAHRHRGRDVRVERDTDRVPGRRRHAACVSGGASA